MFRELTAGLRNCAILCLGLLPVTLVAGALRISDSNSVIIYFDSPDGELIGSPNPYEIGSSSPLSPLKVNEPYCSFFDNRSPREETELGNCTWYRDVSRSDAFKVLSGHLCRLKLFI